MIHACREVSGSTGERRRPSYPAFATGWVVARPSEPNGGISPSTEATSSRRFTLTSATAEDPLVEIRLAAPASSFVVGRHAFGRQLGFVSELLDGPRVLALPVVVVLVVGSFAADSRRGQEQSGEALRVVFVELPDRARARRSAWS